MAVRFVKLDPKFTAKFPAYSEYLAERPGVTMYALLEEEDVCGIMLHEPSRIHYIHVNPALRRGGMATQLVHYAINSLPMSPTNRLYATVEQHNRAALKLFLDCGFDVVGFRHGLKTPAYLMLYSPEPRPPVEIYHGLDKEADEVMSCIVPVETIRAGFGAGTRPSYK